MEEDASVVIDTEYLPPLTSIFQRHNVHCSYTMVQRDRLARVHLDRIDDVPNCGYYFFRARFSLVGSIAFGGIFDVDWRVFVV